MSRDQARDAAVGRGGAFGRTESGMYVGFVPTVNLDWTEVV